jgi:hypothetical protein
MAKKFSEQGKEVNGKIPKNLVNTGFMLIGAKSLSLSTFKTIFLSVFV